MVKRDRLATNLAGFLSDHALLSKDVLRCTFSINQTLRHGPTRLKDVRDGIARQTLNIRSSRSNLTLTVDVGLDLCLLCFDLVDAIVESLKTIRTDFGRLGTRLCIRLTRLLKKLKSVIASVERSVDGSILHTSHATVTRRERSSSSLRLRLSRRATQHTYLLGGALFQHVSSLLHRRHERRPLNVSTTLNHLHTRQRDLAIHSIEKVGLGVEVEVRLGGSLRRIEIVVNVTVLCLVVGELALESTERSILTSEHLAPL